ncbi:MAG: membrane protein insertase YidC [Candidatus Cryptobacteroides sp.]
MDKNSIIGFVLMGVLLFGFTFYQADRSKKQYAIYQAQQDSLALVEAQRQAELALLEGVSEVQTSEAAVKPARVYKDAALDDARNAEGETVCLENDVLALTFSTKGAQPTSARLKEYSNYGGSDLYLFKEGGNSYNVHVYAGEYISTGDFVFQLAEKTDSSVVMRLPFASGGYIEQSYRLQPGSYELKSELSFIGMNCIPRNVGTVDIDFNTVIPRMEKGYKNESQYSKLDFYYTGDKKHEELAKGGRSGSKKISSNLEWFAFQQQFFSMIVRAPGQFASGNLSLNFLGENDPDHNLMRCDASMRVDINPGRDVTIPIEYYLGPNDFRTLKHFDHKYEKIIPLGGWLVGWFTRYFIIPMFDFLHRYIANFGLIILIMTLVIKMVVLPFTYKSYASSAKMNALKPYMEELNKKYPNPDDAMKKQQATMDLYKRAGVSPMGGCLPTLLTFPILWAMFRFFPASIQLRQQRFLWAEDLSAYDSIVDFGFNVPLLGDHLSLFALLMAIVMWGYSKITMSQQTVADDPSAKTMQFMSVWMMPIMMFFICNNLSSGLSYYYLISQIISIIQIFIIRKWCVKPEAVVAKVEASKGKPLPKSKWQQRLEEAQKLQEQQLRAQQKKGGRR